MAVVWLLTLPAAAMVGALAAWVAARGPAGTVLVGAALVAAAGGIYAASGAVRSPRPPSTTRRPAAGGRRRPRGGVRREPMTIHGDCCRGVRRVVGLDGRGRRAGHPRAAGVVDPGPAARYAPAARRPLFSPRLGTAVAAAALPTAAPIVLFGLWVLIAR